MMPSDPRVRPEVAASGPSAEHLRRLWSGLGAVLTGRRTFDVAGTPAVLGNPTVIPGVGVTHLSYPVRKA